MDKLSGKQYGKRYIQDIPVRFAESLRIGDYIMKGGGDFGITEISPKYDGVPLLIQELKVEYAGTIYEVPRGVNNIEQMVHNYCGKCPRGCMYSDIYEEFTFGTAIIHPRENVTWEEVLGSDKYDGVIVRVLGVEYKIKKRYTLDLKATEGGLLDREGAVIFPVVLKKSLGKIVEVTKTGQPIRIRHDKTVAGKVVVGLYIEMSKFMGPPRDFKSYHIPADVYWAECCGGYGEGYHTVECGKKSVLSLVPTDRCTIKMNNYFVSEVPKEKVIEAVKGKVTAHFPSGIDYYHPPGHKVISEEAVEFFCTHFRNITCRFAGMGYLARIHPGLRLYDPRSVYCDLANKLNDVRVECMGIPEGGFDYVELWDPPSSFDYSYYSKKIPIHTTVFVRAPYSEKFMNFDFGDNFVVMTGDNKLREKIHAYLSVVGSEHCPFQKPTQPLKERPHIRIEVLGKNILGKYKLPMSYIGGLGTEMLQRGILEITSKAKSMGFDSVRYPLSAILLKYDTRFKVSYLWTDVVLHQYRMEGKITVVEVGRGVAGVLDFLTSFKQPVKKKRRRWRGLTWENTSVCLWQSDKDGDC
jgi:hypothetical protein